MRPADRKSSMDIQRTILLVIFGMSLVFLWDNWQKHQGRPSMLSPPAADAAVLETMGTAGSESASSSGRTAGGTDRTVGPPVRHSASALKSSSS